MDPKNLKGCISVGPWGSIGARHWSYMAEGSIIQIVIASGEAIDSIIFKHNNGSQEVKTSQKFGGDGGTLIHTIDLNYPTEYLTSINGTIGQFGELLVITSLSFVTNQNSYGPYGMDTGTYFSLPTKGDAIVGFYGYAGHFIRSIGVYMKPISSEPISVGPWGGQDGQEWSYKVEGAITQIVITSGDVINSLKFKGNNSRGLARNSNKFGGNDGSKTETINIDSPTEYLTSINGTFGMYRGLTVVTSLRFNTNKRTIGPFGRELGSSDFSLRMNGNVIVGFHGHAGRNIISIGVFVKPLSPVESTSQHPKEHHTSGYDSVPNKTDVGPSFSTPVVDPSVRASSSRQLEQMMEELTNYVHDQFAKVSAQMKVNHQVALQNHQQILQNQAELAVKLNDLNSLYQDLRRDVGPLNNEDSDTSTNYGDDD